jgi:hypothetical protein
MTGPLVFSFASGVPSHSTGGTAGVYLRCADGKAALEAALARVRKAEAAGRAKWEAAIRREESSFTFGRPASHLWRASAYLRIVSPVRCSGEENRR